MSQLIVSLVKHKRESKGEGDREGRKEGGRERDRERQKGEDSLFYVMGMSKWQSWLWIQLSKELNYAPGTVSSRRLALLSFVQAFLSGSLQNPLEAPYLIFSSFKFSLRLHYFSRLAKVPELSLIGLAQVKGGISQLMVLCFTTPGLDSGAQTLSLEHFYCPMSLFSSVLAAFSGKLSLLWQQQLWFLAPTASSQGECLSLGFSPAKDQGKAPIGLDWVMLENAVI